MDKLNLLLDANTCFTWKAITLDKKNAQACAIYIKQAQQREPQKGKSFPLHRWKMEKPTFSFLIKTNDRNTLKQNKTCCWIWKKQQKMFVLSLSWKWVEKEENNAIINGVWKNYRIDSK